MTKIKLTDITVRKLPLQESQYDVFDTQVPNFGVRVSPKGTKAFTLLYRVGRKKKRLNLGKYPSLSLAQARKIARDTQHNIASGHDPQAEKIKKRRQHEDWTLSSVVDKYIEKHAERNAKRSWRETQRLLRKEFVSRWGRLQVSDVDKSLIHATLDEIHDNNGPSAANHAFAAIRGFFNWCVGREYVDISPCYGLKKPAKTRSRERVLQGEELAAIWKAAEEIGFPYGPFIQLLTLTGQRREEVAHLQWTDINIEDRLWTQVRNKPDRPQLVPLSEQALEVIEAIPRCHDEFLFPARGKNRPISGYSKMKKRLDKVSGVQNWTFNDLRRTLATDMGRLAIDRDIIELTLNHKCSKLSGIAGVYNRYDYLDEKAAALQSLADHYKEIVSKFNDNN